MPGEFIKWKSEFGLSDIITAVSAIATAVMVVYTHLTLKASKKSLQVAQRSAEAAEKSVERMKDSQMPYLSLSVSNPDAKSMALNLNIRNIGAGLAKIRLVSIREDLLVDCVLEKPIKYWVGKPSESTVEATDYERIADFSIASGEEFTFAIDFSRNYMPNEDFMSSLSVFFEDIYGRYYRSRILYRWKSLQGGSHQIRSIDSEMFAIKELPIDTNSNKYAVGDLYELEGFPKPITYRASFLCFHRKSFISRVVGTTLNGTIFTDNRSMILEKIIESWDGYPEFQLRIGTFQSFNIIPLILDGQIDKYIIRGNRDFKEYGLLPTGNNDTELIGDLYQSIVKQLIRK